MLAILFSRRCAPASVRKRQFRRGARPKHSAPRRRSCGYHSRSLPARSGIIVHEPNGNNLGLKIIEKVSPYHREHSERSYGSSQMAAWIRAHGGEVGQVRFAGFVAMFYPDWLARTMKAAEPVIEKTPVLKTFACAVYVIVARRASGIHAEA